MTNEIEFELLPTQWDAQMINANTTFALCQRSGGKTIGILGPRVLRLSELMPRTQILVVSDTYERLMDKIIPNIIYFLEDKLKLIEGIDFVKYRKPPDHWQKPFIKLDKFDKVISFASGMALCLVSLSVEGSANAFNAQAALIDEAKFCKEEKINTEVLPSLRGESQRYGHLPEYLSKWYVTDKFGENIKWLLKMKKHVNHEAVAMVKTLAETVVSLKQILVENTLEEAETKRVQKKIVEYSDRADAMRKHMVYVCEMKPYENEPIVGPFFFKTQRRLCTPYEFDVAILNKDPDKVEHCYYVTLNDKRKYAGITDYDATKALYGAFDYNWRIAPLPIAQWGMLPGRHYNTFNTIDYIYTLAPLGLKDSVIALCKRYEKHENKTFHYVYDKTATGRSPLKTTFFETVVETFEAQGWSVVLHYIGEPPEHDIKYENLKKWLSIEGEGGVMMNEVTCEQLIRAAEQTSTITGAKGKTMKDKRKEKDIKFPAEDAPHGPDAWDMLLIAYFEFNLVSENSYSPDMGVR